MVNSRSPINTHMNKGLKNELNLFPKGYILHQSIQYEDPLRALRVMNFSTHFNIVNTPLVSGKR